ncbi:MAG: HEAT repeat domain-containing protein [Saccharofermentans sp.]|nr:HEAT repeat domain-containing protein [Clostridiales bacterium]MCR5592720.1 HEAT repeat domain-containing protein [Saccharofermentans sp.]
MSRVDSLRNKILKLAAKGKLDGLIKLSGDSDEAVRTEVAIAMGQITTYESGMALIPLLRDSSPSVRAAAATSAADIGAKHCEEYVKKLAFADSDPNVRQIAKSAFDRLKDRVV